MPTATATDPQPDISPIMQSRLVCKDPKPQKIQTQEIIKPVKTQRL